MNNLGTIKIANKSTHAEIRIEGIIGIPENWQFDNPNERVSTYDKFLAQIETIKGIGANRITVHIASLGGNVNDALLIFDALKGLKNADITTVCHAYTASAATIIAQAGNTRQISENALYLIHQASSYAEGNKQDLDEARQLLDATDDRIANIYATASGRPKDDFVALMGENNGNGKWLSPSEAKEYGLVDEIVKADGNITNIVDTAQFGLPSVPQNIIEQMEKNTKTLGEKFREWLGLNDTAQEVDFEKVANDKIAELENVTKERNEAQARIADLEAENTTLKEEQAQHASDAQTIADLQAQVANLSAELDTAKAMNVTKTEPTEEKQDDDPANIKPKMSANEQAYIKDVEQFKN